MSKKSPISRKGSLIYATIVSVACVFTAGVSTFAWFQAQAGVSLTMGNSPTKVTVDNGFNAEIGAEFYFYNNNGANGYEGNPSISFPEDFTKVTAPAHTRLSGVYPGYKMTFAIKTEMTMELGQLRLTITGLDDVAAGVFSDRWDVTEIHSKTSNNRIALARAINIYTGASSSVGALPELTSGFTYLPGQTKYEIFQGSASAGDTYLFYTVEFDGSVKYDECSSVNGGDIIYRNSDYSSITGERFFVRSGSGNSNCFEGKGFNIPQLTISSEAV